MYKSTHHTAHNIKVIKLGGSTLEGLNEAFFANFKTLQQQGYKIIITHGGGPAINRALEKENITSSVVNGLRVTTDDMISIVQSTLIGQVNPMLVSQLWQAGISAIGLNGFDNHLLVSEYIDQQTYGHVGEVKQVKTELLYTLLDAGIVPVIACVGVTEDGQALNINGDTVASEVALAVRAESLLLVTDVKGIRIDGVYQNQATETQIAEWIDDEHIYGGMIPKVQGALACLHAGIPSVQIVNDTLEGTTISHEGAVVS